MGVMDISIPSKKRGMPRSISKVPSKNLPSIMPLAGITINSKISITEKTGSTDMTDSLSFSTKIAKESPLYLVSFNNNHYKNSPSGRQSEELLGCKCQKYYWYFFIITMQDIIYNKNEVLIWKRRFFLSIGLREIS